MDGDKCATTVEQETRRKENNKCPRLSLEAKLAISKSTKRGSLDEV